MKIVEIDVTELHPYENNPRNNEPAVDAVAKSIKEFGFKVPIVVDKDNVIIAGHTRYKASQKLGLTKVPCIIADDLTEEQVKAFRLADNKVGELAEWDYDLLQIELQDITGIDMSEFGFNEDDVNILEPEAEEDNYDVEEGLENQEEPRVHRGEIWQLGKHRLMCGDSTSAEDVAKLMNGEEADLVVTDPPYNVDYGSKAQAFNKYGYGFSDRHIENDYMPQEQFIEFLDKAFANMKDSLKAGGAFYIWHASITVFEFETALRINNLKSRQQLVWVKNALVLGRQDYQWQHEPCLYGWKDGAAHYFVDDRTLTTVIEEERPDFKKMKKDELVALLQDIYSDKISTTIIHEDKPARSPEHPTMKPIKLIARQIKNSSKPNELVLDLFGGSGTTLVTSEQLNRRCNTMEYDEKYASVIVDRYEKLTGNTAVKL